MSECNHDCGSCGQDCPSRQSPESFIEKPNAMSSIKKVIGVVSGKGGVGKSMVTSMLATLLRRKDYGVGVLDADITGPSIPKVFGLHERATANDFGILPVPTKTGIQVMSLNLLLDDETTPVVWRGPIIAGTVKQFWTDVIWDDVDFMFGRPPRPSAARMERRGKSSPAHWRLCGYVNPVRSNIRMGHMRSLARPGDGMRDLPRSLAATQGQDRSPFNTEPGLRSSADGIIHVNTRKYVCARIRPVNVSHQSGKNIFIRIDHGPQIRAVAEKGADNEADGHPGKQEDAQLVVVLLACDKEIKDCRSHIQKPQQVGDNKIFIKGYQVI